MVTKQKIKLYFYLHCPIHLSMKQDWQANPFNLYFIDTINRIIFDFPTNVTAKFHFYFITIDENWYKFTKNSMQRELSKLFNLLCDIQNSNFNSKDINLVLLRENFQSVSKQTHKLYPQNESLNISKTVNCNLAVSDTLNAKIFC